MKIQSIFRNYTAEFKEKGEFLQEIVEEGHQFTVIDQKVLEQYGDALSSLLQEGRYYVLEAVEENKTIEKALEIVDALVQLETKKNTVLLAVGGGIVQDVSCFVASTLYRGITWYFMPTTLLAQTDSCIGSKSSINYGKYKNLIGTFYPPERIGIDTAFLDTLSDRDYRSGLGEIIKIAVMRGKESFYVFRDIIPELLDREKVVLRGEIEKTLEFKKNVIEVDEFDRDYRNIMNYGHTFGHAFESVSHFEIPHGQGVALGMIAANEISYMRGMISKDYRDDMCDAILRILDSNLVRPEYLDAETVIPAMRKDKKFLGGTHTCILVDEKQAKKYNDVSNREVSEALEKVRTVLH